MEHFVQAVTIRWYNACAYYAVSLSKGLVALGHRVTIVSEHGNPVLEKAQESGIDIFENTNQMFTYPLTFFQKVHACRKFAFENNVALVNAHHGSDHLLWSIALRGTGIPLIRTSGNQMPPNHNMCSQFLVKKKSAGVIASCRTIHGFFSRSFDIEPEKIAIINGGVDSDFYTPAHPGGVVRKNLGLPEDAFVFGILARYSPDKGHSNFFRAAEIVAKKHSNAWFLVAGWNAQLSEKDMRSMASEAGISNRTRFAGRYPDNRDLISSLDVGVIASIGSETVCRIAMEYMAMGIPVVATDTNVIPEIVHHASTGLIVPAENPKALASAMEHMIMLKEKARTFGECGRKIIEEEYSLPSFASKTLKAYRSMTHID